MPEHLILIHLKKKTKRELQRNLRFQNSFNDHIHVFVIPKLHNSSYAANLYQTFNKRNKFILEVYNKRHIKLIFSSLDFH